MKPIFPLIAIVLVAGCGGMGGDSRSSISSGSVIGQSGSANQLPAAKAAPLLPLFATEPVGADADDPAIWVHPEKPELSLILGTDKIEATGGLAVFDLTGKVIQRFEKLDRPNNVDVVQKTSFGDLAILTERKNESLRIYKIDPASRQLTEVTGKAKVCQEGVGDFRAPMGVAIFRRKDGAVFAIVSPKQSKPKPILYQYRLTAGEGGKIDASFVRRFGEWKGAGADGEGEVEAIAVDQETGYVYYSDEQNGIWRAQADPDAKAEAPILFAKDGYRGDREGLAVITIDKQKLLLSSDQIVGGSKVHVYKLDGKVPTRVTILDSQSDETDGLDATTAPLGEKLPEGALVMMHSSGKAFHVYDLREVKRAVLVGRSPSPAGIPKPR